MSVKLAQVGGSPLPLRSVASASARGARRMHLVHRRLDLVETEVVGDLLGVVDDVVEYDGSAGMSSRSIGVTYVVVQAMRC